MSTSSLPGYTAFATTRGSVYSLDRGPEGEAISLTLVDVGPYGSAPDTDAEPRAFSLVFRGPLDPQFGQGPFSLRHPELGSFVLFAVPVARTADGIDYEAVFG